MMGVKDTHTGAFASELSGEVPDEVAVFVAEIRRRHGDSLAAVLFYGSCLRKRDASEGVLDFYALVDSYRGAYDSGLMAATNALLPPNVFYVELDDGGTTVRAKYAVVSMRDFSRAATGAGFDSIIWARFSQPARLAWCRDDDSARVVASAVCECAVTMVRHALTLDESDLDQVEVDPDVLWDRAFAATYTTELRTESASTIRELYAADPARYRQATEAAISILAARGEVDVEEGFSLPTVVTFLAATRKRARQKRRRRRPIGKVLYAARLVKSAWTFGDWVPYALWKLERHSGVRLELTDRQRRHPLIFAWPVIIDLLRKRTLR